MHDNKLSDSSNWFSTPNVLSQFIPYYSDLAQLAADLAFNPLEGIDVTALTFIQIDELLIGEKTPLEPTAQMVRTALTWHSMLHAGLRRRNPCLPRARQLYWEAVTHNPNDKNNIFNTPTRGISVQVVKGPTGTGKSVTMERFCNLLPPVIRHTENDAAGWKAMTQLVYLQVAISHDGTRGGFLVNILLQIDAMLGTSYSTDLPKKYKTVETLGVAVICRLIAHHTGIIFLEEGQLRNLVLAGQASLMQGFLLMLMNSGIPIVFLGNERAFDWISYSQDTSRLYTTPCEHFMPIGAIAADKESREEANTDWDAIAKGVMSCFCLSVPIRDPQECKRRLKQHSGGIPRLALFLWCMAQRNVLIFGKDSLAPEDITYVYDSSVYAEHRDLADGFAFRKSDRLIDIDDVDIGFYERYWQSVNTAGTLSHSTTENSVKSDEKPSKPVKNIRSERAKFRAEQTKQKNQKAKRTELAKTLPDDDIRKSGLSGFHAKGLESTLAAGRSVSA